jgi:hypothetical protein
MPDYEQLIRQTAEKYGVDADLMLRMADVESGYDPEAVSPKGARGLFQLMPKTAGQYGGDPDIPEQNIEMGIRHFKRLSDYYRGNVTKAVAAYNAGEGTVDKYGGIPPFKETQDYVTRILGVLPPEKPAQQPRAQVKAQPSKTYSVKEFAELWRKKFPKAYDEDSDETLTRRIIKTYPEKQRYLSRPALEEQAARGAQRAERGGEEPPGKLEQAWEGAKGIGQFVYGLPIQAATGVPESIMGGKAYQELRDSGFTEEEIERMARRGTIMGRGGAYQTGRGGLLDRYLRGQYWYPGPEGPGAFMSGFASSFVPQMRERRQHAAEAAQRIGGRDRTGMENLEALVQTGAAGFAGNVPMFGEIGTGIGEKVAAAPGGVWDRLATAGANVAPFAVAGMAGKRVQKWRAGRRTAAEPTAQQAPAESPAPATNVDGPRRPGIRINLARPVPRSFADMPEIAEATPRAAPRGAGKPVSPQEQAALERQFRQTAEASAEPLRRPLEEAAQLEPWLETGRPAVPVPTPRVPPARQIPSRAGEATNVPLPEGRGVMRPTGQGVVYTRPATTTEGALFETKPAPAPPPPPTTAPAAAAKPVSAPKPKGARRAKKEPPAPKISEEEMQRRVAKAEAERDAELAAAAAERPKPAPKEALPEGITERHVSTMEQVLRTRGVARGTPSEVRQLAIDEAARMRNRELSRAEKAAKEALPKEHPEVKDRHGDKFKVGGPAIDPAGRLFKVTGIDPTGKVRGRMPKRGKDFGAGVPVEYDAADITVRRRGRRDETKGLGRKRPKEFGKGDLSDVGERPEPRGFAKGLWKGEEGGVDVGRIGKAIRKGREAARKGRKEPPAPTGVLPGMAKAVEEQRAAAGKVRAEELTAELAKPLPAPKGRAVTESRLFREAERQATPQGRLFEQLAKGEEGGIDLRRIRRAVAKGVKAAKEPTPQATRRAAEEQVRAAAGAKPERKVSRATVDEYGKLSKDGEFIFDQAENIRQTGTIQPKEARPGFRMPTKPRTAKPDEYMVSQKKVRDLNAHIVDTARRLKKLEEASKANPDISEGHANALKAAREKMDILAAKYKRLRPAAGRAVKEFDFAVPAELLAELQQAGLFVRQAMKPGMADWFYEAWINGLLSGPATHVVNFTSNALIRLSVPTIERPMAAALDILRVNIKGGPRERFFGESYADVVGMVQGVPMGLANALKAWHTEQGTFGLTKLDLPRQRAIPGKIGKKVRVPGRALIAADEFFKAINYQAELRAQAYRQAAMEGKTGAARALRMEELVKKPTEPLVERATADALYRVFQQPYGAAGRQIAQLRAVFGAKNPARLVVPFLRTPINIAKYGVERTPPNFLRLLEKYREVSRHRQALEKEMGRKATPQELENYTAEKMGGRGWTEGRIMEELARPMMGTIVGIGVTLLAAEGFVTGGGPTDQNERRVLYETGWQPFSMKIGDTYYSYSRLEPIGMLLGLSADFYEGYTSRSEEKNKGIAGNIIKSVGRNLLSKTYMRGLSDAFNAFTYPERYGDKWVERMAGTLIPTVVASAARATDPYFRDPQSVTELLKSRIPGLSKEVPPIRGVFGKPARRGGHPITRFISPVYVSPKRGGLAAEELLRLQMRAAKPRDEFSIAGQKIGMSAEQYGQYQETRGQLAEQIVDRMARSPGWQNLPRDMKLRMIRNAFSRSADLARVQVLGSLSPEQLQPGR